MLVGHDDVVAPCAQLSSYYNAVNGTGGTFASAGPVAGTAGRNYRNVGHGEAPGSRYDWQAQQRCTTTMPSVDLPASVTPVQYSSWSAWAFSWYVTDVPGPSVSAWNSVGTVYAPGSYVTYIQFSCSAGNNPVGSQSRTIYVNPSGYSAGYYDYPDSRSGYCQGAWTGAGAKNSASVSGAAGGVYVVNPAPPAPSGFGQSGGQTVYCDGGYGLTLRWDNVPGASYYQIDYNVQLTN